MIQKKIKKKKRNFLSIFHFLGVPKHAQNGLALAEAQKMITDPNISMIFSEKRKRKKRKTHNTAWPGNNQATETHTSSPTFFLPFLHWAHIHHLLTNFFSPYSPFLFFHFLVKNFTKMIKLWEWLKFEGARPTTRYTGEINFRAVHVVAQVAAHATCRSALALGVMANSWWHFSVRIGPPSLGSPSAQEPVRQDPSPWCGYSC